MVGLIDRIDLDGLAVDHDSPIVPAGSAVFSLDRVHRYALAREWDAARPPAVFVMLNPSTADAFIMDPTVTRCRGFAITWGCGGLLVLNAFALRSTDPRRLRTHPDPVGVDNDRVISAVLDAGEVGPVTVAWGSDPTLLRSGRAGQLLTLLREHGLHPQCLGMTKDGHPRHPLYVRGDTQPQTFQET